MQVRISAIKKKKKGKELHVHVLSVNMRALICSCFGIRFGMTDVDIKIPLLMTHDNAVNGPLLYAWRKSQYNNNNNKDVRAEV